jgi:hypothetical protein
MNTTDHFSIERWADFARHVAENADVMRAHLEAGCQKCAEWHATFASLYDLASRDARYEPPASTMRLAKAVFDGAQPSGALARASRAVRLLFDSQLMAAPAGVRSIQGPPRRLVFAAGDLIVDLQVASSLGSRGKVMVGQLTVPVQVRRGVQGMNVRLHTGAEVLAKGATNKLGEFHLEFEDPGIDVTLALGSDPDSTVIPLGMLTSRTDL